MAKTYLVADTHFFHASPDKPDGIIKMCNRPFSSGREMNSVMAANWRKVIRPNDAVIVNGDFAHRAEPESLRKLFDSLPGKRRLVVGNHDSPEIRALPWDSVQDVAYVSIDSQRVVLCHYAWRTWPGIRKGALMLYGHNHGRLPGNSQSMDIGVDTLGVFAPVRLATIKAHLATLPPLVDPEAGDDFDNGGVVPR